MRGETASPVGRGYRVLRPSSCPLGSSVLTLAAVKVGCQRGEHGHQDEAGGEHPGSLPGVGLAGHQASYGCRQVADGVGIDDGLKPAWHGLGVDEDVADE